MAVQAAAELHRVVPEDEPEVELLARWPASGGSSSSSMHTPTTRPARRVVRRGTAWSIMPGHADRLEEVAAAPSATEPTPRVDGRLLARDRPPRGAHRGGQRPAGGREVGGDDRLDACERRSAAMIARPTGPQPSTTAALPAWIVDLLTAWSPTAIGSVSAACRGSSPLGTFMQSMSDSTIRSRVAARVARWSSRRRGCRSGSNAIGSDTTTSPTAHVADVVADLEDLGAELVAHHDVAGEDP